MDHDIAVKSKTSERYLLGELSPEERDEFEAHFFECAACGEEVKSADLFLQGVREVLAETPPARKAAEIAPSRKAASQGGWWTWFGALRPGFAVAALAAVLVISGESIMLVRTRQSLAEATAPRLLASAVLRPETRGEPARVYAPGGRPLLLTFDVVSPQGYPRYLLRINSASGAKVLELTGAAPPPEKPVTLSIPGGTLSAGRYTLVVHGLPAAGETGTQLGQYHFEVLDKEEPAQ